MEGLNLSNKNVFKVLMVFLAVLSLYFAVKFLVELKSYMGGNEYTTITLSGHGEVQAVPDVATVYFTISKEAKTVKEAQDAVTEVEKKSLDLLKENNILEKDIKTTSSSFTPKYSYDYGYCVTYPCPRKTPSIVGYTVSESITVKIRNTDEAGKIIQGLGTLGVTDLSGPNFAIDDEEGLKAEARKQAIDDAKEKAKVLAKDLGVKLGKVVSFNESGDYPMPYYAEMDMVKSVSSGVSTPTLPKGENTISSDVSITYEIR